MLKIVLASRNKKKKAELQTLLSQYVGGIEILSLDDVEIYGEIEEDGLTFEENAFLKASAAAKLGYFSIGEDSGLSVTALDGAPGIYSARYAGEHGNDAANNALLLKNLSDKTDRSAKFVCTISLIDPADPTQGKYFRGETEGVILHEARGEGGFGYDPLFFYEPMGLSFSEMSGAQKNSISHRGKAIELLADYLKELL